MSETDNNGQNQKPGGSHLTIVVLVFFAIGVYILAVILWPGIKREIHRSRSHQCGNNIFELGNGLHAYAKDHDGRYPTENWCDLLLDGGYAAQKQFVCPGGGKGRCHYAMNRNVVSSRISDLPDDMVVLFETKGGWNQVGEVDILTTKNHFREGCNILFNDRHAQFWETAQLGELKWKVEESGSGREGLSK